MFEQMSEQEARESILRQVDAYCKKYHKKKEWKSKERIPYAARVYDSREMVNLVDSSLEFWLTAGRYTQQFEQKFSEYLGVKYCSLVNSGSSANLLAFMALTSPLLGSRRIERGDEVITVAAGFPTTIAPIVQFGAVPVFVDVTIPQYNLDIHMLENAVSEKTKAVIAAHTLGNPFDLESVKKFCEKYDLWLVEDNCDALGSEYQMGEKLCLTGTIGDLATSSFYPPHHMTMGEGGAVYTKHPLLHQIVRSLRDWGRDCICPSGHDNTCGHRFEKQYGELPLGYDHKYVYSHFGYNLKATDLQAAIGCAQLDRLQGFVQSRRRNFEKICAGLSDLGDRIILPKACARAIPSWFGFPITCGEGLDRGLVTQELEQSGIQTRLLFAGNITRQPCFDSLRQAGQGFRIAGSLENTDRVMKDTFWIGVYPGLTDLMLDEMAQAVRRAVLAA